MTPRHIKLTEHFLERAREINGHDRDALNWLLYDGALLDTAQDLRYGERAAVALGRGAVVFCIDEEDHHVVALLTYLPEEKVKALARRRDTRLVRLRLRRSETGEHL